MTSTRAAIFRTAVVLAFTAGCAGLSPLDQLLQLKTFSRCEFRLASVEGTALAGVAIQGRAALSDLGPLEALTLAAALRRPALPLTFTLNVEAKNPNDETAAMNKLAWILLIDGTEMTSGLLDRRVEVAPSGGVAPVPLAITVDLKQALSGRSRDALLNLAFNVAGLGANPTRITLKAKPSMLVGGQLLDYPGYLTVTTEFGGTPASAAAGDDAATRLGGLLSPAP